MKVARGSSLFTALLLLGVSVAAGQVYANEPPIITCPAPTDPAWDCDTQLIDGGDGIFNLGDLVSGSAVASDPDNDPLAFSIVSITRDGQPATPINAPSIDNSGSFSWQTAGEDTEGMWEICLAASDGELADTCCFGVELSLKFYLSIKDVTGSADTIVSLPGMEQDVYINLSPAAPLSSLDLQVRFNDEFLFFRGPVTPLNNLSDWEYFTYRVSFDTSCAGIGPCGLIAISSVADLDNGPAMTPPESSFGLSGNIAHLHFDVTLDWNVLGQCLPFEFCSVDCDDNRLVSKDGSVGYMPVTAASECLAGSTIANIETCSGYICVRDPDPADCDINLNGIGFEVGDVVLFSNWFIYGDDVLLPPWIGIQLQNMDCNNDGISATFADLVFMIRAIADIWGPFDLFNLSADITTKTEDGRVEVSAASAAAIGGALFTFEYDGVNVGEPVLPQPMQGMAVKSRAANGELKVLLIPSLDGEIGTISPGQNSLVEIPVSGNGSFELKKVELADAAGQVLPGRILVASAHPSSYALLQNYPNPFNAGTVIPFDLQDASEWELTIYNIVGQEVRAFRGVSGASRVEVNWDGANRAGQQVASGMYFYRVRAGDFVASRKMILLK